MTIEKTQVKVGDVMIYRPDYGEVPQRVNVAKVTKAGWIKFAHADGSESSYFKRAWNDEFQLAQTTRLSRRHPVLYLDGEAKWNELVEAAAKAKQQRAEKDAERELNQKAREEREAAELAAVKAALGGDYRDATLFCEMLEDGSQVRVIRLPVQEEHVERKGKTRIVVLKVKREDRMWNKDEPTWECYPTVADKSTDSWGSYSGSRGTTADAAVWEALRYLYTSW